MITATQQFIGDAIKGGWDGNGGFETYEERIRGWYFHDFGNEHGVYLTLAEILLDPLAWQAVGKTRGWGMMEHMDLPLWRDKLHSFIDHLADGKSIEDALTAITN